MPKIGLFGGYGPKMAILALFGPSGRGFYINLSRRGPAVSRGGRPPKGVGGVPPLPPGEGRPPMGGARGKPETGLGK